MCTYLSKESDNKMKRQNHFLSLKLNILLRVLFVLMFGTKVIAVTRDGICRSKDIQSPNELMTLYNCRVIEGFLMISRIDSYNDTDYDNFTFPDLVEITDFLLLYRVQRLRTLSHLFPNLRVIRGNNLVNNYALIIYENMHLEDIGLKSLTTIIRGGVRIEKNPSLCFVDTVNWLYIANGTKTEDYFFDANKDSNECPVCPTVFPIGKKSDGDDYIRNDIGCRRFNQYSKKKYCWNLQYCQKICPDSCGGRSCDDKGNCCHDSCLGSCAYSPRDCAVCRKLSVGPLQNRECVDTCPQTPKKLYMFDQHRCITDTECWNISKPVVTPEDIVLRNPFIPYNGTCSWKCPKYHTAEGLSGGRICRDCDGECKKQCRGSIIDSIATAQNYRGCRIITGTLIIRIRQCQKNIMKELEFSLSDIEEIEGGLKIIGSYPLISLNFFKKLKVIHGLNPQENYTLYVVDNQNLQTLFRRKVIIEHGKIFFHSNSKLCYATIENLKPDVFDLRGVEKFAVEDVALSNGDKTACNITILQAIPSSVMSVGAIIDVYAIKYDDSRVLLGYQLHYKSSEYQNLSLFENRDACGGDGWQIEDSTDFDRRASIIQIVLIDLKPFTQYAYYVKTFTVESEQFGGHTDILYFRTLPSKPGIVHKMNLTPNGSSSIIVDWKPPKVPNGRITNYIVKASLIHDNPELLQQRNYCVEPIEQPEDKVKNIIFKQSRNSNEKSYSSSSDDNAIDFDDEIQYIFSSRQMKLLMNTRRTLETDGEEPSNQSNWNPFDPEEVFPTSRRTVGKPTNDFTQSKIINGTFSTYFEELYDSSTNASMHTFTLNQLRHFSTYSITVQACRDLDDPSFNVNTFCSNKVMLNRRTGRKDDADDIDPKSFKYNKVSNSNNSLSTIKLNWQEPKDPNGFILSYTISYERVDLVNVKPTEQCITRHIHANLSGEIPLLQLSNGNYSISVRATSLAGDGKLTPPIYIFIDDYNSTMRFVIITLGVLLLLGVVIYAVRFLLHRNSSSSADVKFASISSSALNKEVIPLV